MSQWGNNDQANNSPVWAPAQFNEAPTTANRDALYGNTTANGVVNGAIIGVYAVDQSEMAYGRGSKAGVVSITVTANGTGYQVRPTVTITNAASDSTGSGATATATAQVLSAVANAVGTGGTYIPGETLTVSGGTGTAAVLTVAQTAIRAVPAITNGGSGYANGDIVQFATGTGTQANLTVTTGAADSIVASLALTTNGAYTVNPTLTNAATTNATGSGTGLRITANTRVKTVTVSTVGEYTALPTTNAAGHSTANGSGATFVLTFGVKNVTVTNAGSNYSLAPTVAFGGTGGTGSTGTAVRQNPGGPAAGVTHTGWVVTRTGTGGRAGRVTSEVLVAGGIANDASSDDSKFPQ